MNIVAYNIQTKRPTDLILMSSIWPSLILFYLKVKSSNLFVCKSGEN